jgi:hypothetical protein
MTGFERFHGKRTCKNVQTQGHNLHTTFHRKLKQLHTLHRITKIPFAKVSNGIQGNSKHQIQDQSSGEGGWLRHTGDINCISHLLFVL